MSQHNGHTDSDGMISDMAEGSGAWRTDFPDDSDFGTDGSGSGDGFSGEFRDSGGIYLLFSSYLDKNINLLNLFLPQD